MHPVVDERVALICVKCALGLRDLVFVVRKLQVLAAAMDVEMVAQERAGHRRAFDMPAGTPLAPRARPRRLARLRMLPQHEIERVVLGLRYLDALARIEIVERFARKLAVARKIAHRVVDVTVRRHVSEPLLLQQTNDFLHLGDVFGRARLKIRLDYAQRSRILVHRGDETSGQCRHRFLVVCRALDDLVVDIRNIAHVSHVEARGTQPARHHVEHNHDPGVAKMAVVVNRHAADVNPRLPGHQRLEFPFIAGERVIELEHGGKYRRV